MKTSISPFLPLTAIALAVAGCASMESNESLEQARIAVDNAQRDPVAVEQASVELNRAREALGVAEAVWDEEGDAEIERVDHQSYLARRYAETAIALADAARAEEAIEEADAERAQVQLEIRTLEAELNEREAEAARLEAARNQRAAELAERDAQAALRSAATAEAQARALAEELEARETERGLVLTLGDVLFDVDRAELKPGAESTMDRLAEFLGDYPERELIIEGHTDSTGPDAYNEMLSQRRANAVASALQQRGVPRSRLQIRGLGETQPVATNDTVVGRQQNRRVEVVIAN